MGSMPCREIHWRMLRPVILTVNNVLLTFNCLVTFICFLYPIFAIGFVMRKCNFISCKCEIECVDVVNICELLILAKIEN